MIHSVKVCLHSFQEVLQREIVELNHLLQEERFRTERLEEQVNDLTELHQNEVENLKQTMTDMEEKVQYQSEERLRDIHDMLESCQTKVNLVILSLFMLIFPNNSNNDVVVLYCFIA